MERLRVVLFTQGRSLAEAGIPDACFAGAAALAARDPRIEDLPSLAPQVVVVAVPTFEAGLETARRVLRALPGTVTLMVGGPDVGAHQVLEAVRLGVRDVLIGPSGADLLGALERVGGSAARAADAGARPSGEVFVVHSPKGGSGKSTLAANLAAVLQSETTLPVALVDLALGESDLDLLLNVKAPATWADLARCGAFGAEELEAVLVGGADRPRLLAAPPDPAGAELVGPAVVERAIGLLRGRFRFIVVDTPSSLTEPTAAALRQADRLVVPLPLTVPSLRRAQHFLKLCAEFGFDPSAVVLAAWEPRGAVAVEAAQKLLGRPIAHCLPCDPRAVEEALNTGELLVAAWPYGAYARAVRALACSLRGMAAPRRERRTLWGLLKAPRTGARRRADVLA